MLELKNLLAPDRPNVRSYNNLPPVSAGKAALFSLQKRGFLLKSTIFCADNSTRFYDLRTNYAKGAMMRNLRSILLVEDDSVDAMTVKRAFGELKVKNELIRAINGEAALNYLREHLDQKPCVILLDLNMPKMNGIEFLKVMKADDELRPIPVVVLTTSKDDRDKMESFKACVAGYIVKPVDYRKFVEAMKILNLYWTLSEIPGNVTEPETAEKPAVA